jgi:hypothetical protein
MGDFAIRPHDIHLTTTSWIHETRHVVVRPATPCIFLCASGVDAQHHGQRAG